MERAVRPRLRVIPRSEWGARPPQDSPEIPAMVHPGNVVYFTYATGTSYCEDRESCCRILREIQDRQMDEGAPDIAYNFLVGGDQWVYVDRGWWRQPERSRLDLETGGRLVEIAFIGDYASQVLPYSLAKVALELVGNSIHDKYLTSSYRLQESHKKLNFDQEY